jgi:aminobenzoyl-glutamate utilization protein A
MSAETYTDRSLREIRRDLHAHPEEGWREYRTTALVAEALDALDYTVHLGADALAVDERMGVPESSELASARERAREEAAPAEYLEVLEATTGLVAERSVGTGEGPVVGVRIDMDALPISEAADDDHRPAREGFASRHPGEMHACGHDGHTAIGIGIARTVADREPFDGRLKLFFQPAEEGLRGGRAMSRTDHLADVDYFLGLHLGLDRPTGTVVAGLDRPFSSAKVEVRFEGESAHAGNAPEAGRNALQAATTAITNLYGLPRHSEGITRINVGDVRSPNAQNVVADDVRMRYEVRSDVARVNEELLEGAGRVVDGAARMHGVDAEESVFGRAPTFEADGEMIETAAAAARAVGGVEGVIECARLTASEDVAHLVERVQSEGGTATYLCVGASNAAGHHNPRFDVDEAALEVGVDVVVETARRLAG